MDIHAYFFFLTIICFHVNHIHTKSPLCKIVTFSHEIGSIKTINPIAGFFHLIVKDGKPFQLQIYLFNYVVYNDSIQALEIHLSVTKSLFWTIVTHHPLFSQADKS